VTRVVDHHVEATVCGDDRFDRGVGRGLGGDIQLDGAEIDGVLGGILLRLGDLPRVAAGRLAHGGIRGVTRPSQRAGGQRAEAARREYTAIR